MSAFFQAMGNKSRRGQLRLGGRNSIVALKWLSSVGFVVFIGPGRSLMLPPKFHEVLFQGVWREVFNHRSVFFLYLGKRFDSRQVVTIGVLSVTRSRGSCQDVQLELRLV